MQGSRAASVFWGRHGGGGHVSAPGLGPAGSLLCPEDRQVPTGGSASLAEETEPGSLTRCVFKFNTELKLSDADGDGV